MVTKLSFYFGQVNIFCFFPVCPSLRLRNLCHEKDSAVPSRVSPLVLHTQAVSGATQGSPLPPAFRDGVVHLLSNIISIIICHRVSFYSS